MSPLSNLPPELFWTSVISARDAMAGRRRAVKQTASPASDLFADENKDASGQCYDVEEKYGRAEIQAEP